MAPKGAQEIEIEKTHGDPLPLLNQAVTKNYPDFLGTALWLNITLPGVWSLLVFQTA
jgi:hypothetical protein